MRIHHTALGLTAILGMTAAAPAGLLIIDDFSTATPVVPWSRGYLPDNGTTVVDSGLSTVRLAFDPAIGGTIAVGAINNLFDSATSNRFANDSPFEDTWFHGYDDDDNSGTDSGFWPQAVSDALGGSRKYRLQNVRFSGPAPGAFSEMRVQADRLVLSNESGYGADALLRYDGGTDTSAADESLDADLLTQAVATLVNGRFELSYFNTDSTALSVSLTLWSNNLFGGGVTGSGVTVAKTTNADGDPGTLVWNFSEFVGVNFSNVDRIELRFASPRGYDGQFDNFVAVPEPSTMLLLVAGSVGIMRRRR